MTIPLSRVFSPRTRRAATAALTALVLSLGAVSCAAESDDAGGSPGKGSDSTSPETQWERESTTETLNHTLPESFPSDLFALPSEATIYNTGERSDSEWFLVLKATDAEAARVIWDAIVQQNMFSVSDEATTSDGGVSATLTSESLAVQALTITDADGSVLLSYDLTRTIATS